MWEFMPSQVEILRGGTNVPWPQNRVEPNFPVLFAACPLCGLSFTQVFLLSIQSPTSKNISLIFIHVTISFLTFNHRSIISTFYFLYLYFYFEVILNFPKSCKNRRKNTFFPLDHL